MLDMGRRFPHDNISLTHPILYLSFIAVGLAASIAIVTALCGVRFWKKSPSPPQSSSSDPIELEKDLDSSSPPSNMVATDKVENHENIRETENNDTQTKELPLPPSMQQPHDLFHCSSMMKRATSERRTSFSLSIKMPRSFSVAKMRDLMEDKGNNIKGKLKSSEDSVWMKTIILGEKCVPDEEDPVIYEGRGKKISAYHPKNSSSISVSRQCSFIDPDAISVPKPQTQEEIIPQ
ncbi:hypothetical protein Lalb_Chr23g0267841 [Lupinus albus]|uniref:Transmembrane protein n=1 Tax=Lupinus albus TaxID=3870 RepID=A0A6A4NBK1_LUPAL|nr:hypothetical protein Lalb_Chr23g0267841 [Lupinus albus]